VVTEIITRFNIHKFYVLTTQGILMFHMLLNTTAIISTFSIKLFYIPEREV